MSHCAKKYFTIVNIFELGTGTIETGAEPCLLEDTYKISKSVTSDWDLIPFPDFIEALETQDILANLSQAVFVHFCCECSFKSGASKP